MLVWVLSGGWVVMMAAAVAWARAAASGDRVELEGELGPLPLPPSATM